MTAPIGPLITNNIKAPMIRTPNTGNKKIGFNPSNDFGNHEKANLRNEIIPPAKNPAMSAPRNPEETYPSAKTPPVAKSVNKAGFANTPPMKPTTKPGRSAIDCPIKPANIGSIIAKANLPIRKIASAIGL